MTIKRGHDELQDLTKGLSSMKVHSEASQKRIQLKKNILDPIDEDDMSDSTFELHSGSESGSDSDSIEMDEEVMVDTTEELKPHGIDTGNSKFSEYDTETVIPDYEPTHLGPSDQGHSDYYSSDDGDGPDVGTMYPKKKDYKLRAQNMLTFLPPIQHHWVIKMARYNSNERRWVNKGPVMIYFIHHANEPVRLIGHYLYSTKSICFDIQLYEFFKFFIKHYPSNRIRFSTFKQNGVKSATIQTNAILMNQQKIFQCRSVIEMVQEDHASLFDFKFINQQDYMLFGECLDVALGIVHQREFQRRLDSYTLPIRVSNKLVAQSTYIQSPDFVNQLCTSGLKFNPSVIHGLVCETVQCVWCGCVLGPFDNIVDVNEIHCKAHGAGYHVTCPFIRYNQ
ncbi:hypothetical protein BC833DRAFT_603825 [Globomyces pollinis-pini]|nr:hypothetical protein BC833DRAFT_603825 [Globomyces pollinis-pini]